MGIRQVIKDFEYCNVCVVGLRRRGKDMLFANVICRRNIPYSSNVNYFAKLGAYYKFDPVVMKCGGNMYDNFITGDILYYEYPYPEGTDIYISDVGVYFPSQYCNELNRKYPQAPTFMAISQHVGRSNVHVNCQNLGRVWDKLREQSDCYYMCLWCKVICGFVIQKVRYYDREESCRNRVKPFNVPVPIFGSSATRSSVRMQKASFEATHGIIKNHLLIYRNLSSYDTRIFKQMLKNGRKLPDHEDIEVVPFFTERKETFFERCKKFIKLKLKKD